MSLISTFVENVAELVERRKDSRGFKDSHRSRDRSNSINLGRP